jgi:hypothetical protein
LLVTDAAGRVKHLALLTVTVGSIAFASPPSPEEIIQRSIEVNEANWKEAPGYSFVERDVETKHGSGKTIKTYEVLMIDGSPYNKVTAINDRPLSAGEKALEEEKLQQEIQKRQHESSRERARRMAKYLKERNQDHAMMKEMAEAFHYTLAGEDKINGHDVWLLEATPKPGYQPRSREAKVLTGMKGRLWIDKASYQWAKVDAQVFRAVSFYGFFAKVGPGTRFVLEQEPVTRDLWLPRYFSMKVNASALGFINENSAEEDTYRDYRPTPKAMADLQGTR